MQLLEQLLIRTGKIDLFVIVQRGALLDKGLVRHQDVPDRYLLGESAAHPDGDHPLDPEDSERLDGVHRLRRSASAVQKADFFVQFPDRPALQKAGQLIGQQRAGVVLLQILRPAVHIKQDGGFGKDKRMTTVLPVMAAGDVLPGRDHRSCFIVIKFPHLASSSFQKGSHPAVQNRHIVAEGALAVYLHRLGNLQPLVGKTLEQRKLEHR